MFQKPKKENNILPDDAIYITIRRSTKSKWVAETLTEDEDGHLVFEKLCEPGSRMQAILKFKQFAMRLFNAK